MEVKSAFRKTNLKLKLERSAVHMICIQSVKTTQRNTSFQSVGRDSLKTWARDLKDETVLMSYFILAVAIHVFQLNILYKYIYIFIYNIYVMNKYKIYILI